MFDQHPDTEAIGECLMDKIYNKRQAKLISILLMNLQKSSSNDTNWLMDTP